jgi:phage tail-like protein
VAVDTRSGARRDPLSAFRFLVEVSGIVTGGFTEVTGLQSELETFDYREGGRNEFVHRLAGPVRYPSNLVLRRGLVTPELWNWYQASAAGRIERAHVSVLMLDAARESAWRWSFIDAYPIRWLGPDLRASSSMVAVEAVELTHRGVDPHESGPGGPGVPEA